MPWNKHWMPPMLLCLLGLGALWIDVPVARLARDGAFAKLREVFENLEAFGHGAGVAAIALVVCCLETRQRWRHVIGILLAALGSGLAANALKLVIRRDRPWDIAGEAVHGLNTFGGLFSSLGGLSHAQSFPSAHAATAMGLAVALAGYYPRGRYIFYALAGATALSRVIAPSHFISDTLAGLALGIVIGQAVVRSARWAPAGERDPAARLQAARLTDVPGTRGETSSSELVRSGL
jgi:membrane-associated phospholipid phosphatase